MFFVYNLCLLIVSPLAVLVLLYSILLGKRPLRAWLDQLGFVRRIKSKKPIVWIHAVSVGESVAAAAIVSELKNSVLRDYTVVFSNTTKTGNEMALKLVKDADEFIYFPFDYLPCVWLSLVRVKPDIFATIDTEIWPNFFMVAHMLGVRTSIINATLSDKTLNFSKKYPFFYKKVMSVIDLFCAQSQIDADNIIKLGVDPNKVFVTGNCKADQGLDRITEDEIRVLSKSFGISDGDRVFVAGSTNPGEDEPVLAAFARARKNHPNLRLIIAPRQIERRNEIYEIAKNMGFSCAWRSEPDTINSTKDVIILDTFGELARVYALCDISFVGGSLIPKGCHSILQPIELGKGVFFGPYTFKAKDLVAQAKHYEIGFEIKDAAELGEMLSDFLADADLLERIKINCASMIKANAGASKRTVQKLATLAEDNG